MKKLLPIILLFLFAKSFAAEKHIYKLDDSAVEAMFQASDDVTSELMSSASAALLDPIISGKMMVEENNTQMIAGIVALAQVLVAYTVISVFAALTFGVGGILFPLVWVPWHRLVVLKTGGKGVGIFFAYFCTFGGCVVLPIVDGVMCLIDMKGTQYINNSRFLMFTKKKGK